MEHPDPADSLDLAARLSEQGRYSDAHDQLDRAGAISLREKDAGLSARVDEARARVFLAERKYHEARRVIDRAVETLEKGGESAALAGALTTRGVVLARLGDSEGSVNSLRRAMELAERAGDLSATGLAALTLIEEHRARRSFPLGGTVRTLPARRPAAGRRAAPRHARAAAGVRPRRDAAPGRD